MGSERAFRIRLPPGESSSSGFLKLLISTGLVHLEWIQQRTPFEPQSANVGHSWTTKPFKAQTKSENMGGLEVVQEPLAKWDVLTLKLTARADRD